MNSKKNASDNVEIAVFGNDGPKLLENIRTVLRGLDHTPVRYRYLSIEEHKELFLKDPVAGVRLQIVELLYHSHFASVATLVRAYRWAEGCLAAYSQDLFLPFCASARGLLEAVGDSFDALPRVPLALAQNHEVIKNALAGVSPPVNLRYKEIEDILLHFSHARRVDRSEKNQVPEYLPAKLASVYTKPLEDFAPGNFYGWYQELCEFAHPASDSVCYMLVPNEDGRLELQPSVDRERIHAHISAHQDRLAELLRLSQVPALVMLRVLAHIGPAELNVRTLDQLNISHIKLWQKCAAAMNVNP